MESKVKKLGFGALVALVISSSTGSGIFGIASDMADTTSPGAAQSGRLRSLRRLYQQLGLLAVRVAGQCGVCDHAYERGWILLPRF